VYFHRNSGSIKFKDDLLQKLKINVHKDATFNEDLYKKADKW